MCPPYDGNGSYSAPANSWNPAVDDTDISTTDWAALLADLSTALSTVICKDGQTVPTANIPLGGFKLTGVGAATAAGDALIYGQSPVLLTTLTASSSASLSFTAFSATYKSYRFIFNGIVPATDNVDFYCQLSLDGGANWLAGTDYVYGAHYWNTSLSSAGNDFNVPGTSVWNLSPTNGNGISNASWFSGSLDVQDMNSTTIPQTARYDFIYQRTGVDFYFGGNGNAIYAATIKTAKNGIKFYMSSGNIASGTIQVYGVP